jgi:hypothetical protein
MLAQVLTAEGPKDLLRQVPLIGFVFGRGSSPVALRPV